MNIKRFNKVMFKLVIVILSIAIPMYFIGYYLLIKFGFEVLNKIINL
jgi:uncharacterized membrane protein YkvI